MTISKYIKKCPYCGSEEYYIKQTYKGECNFHTRFDGEESDQNSNMHEGILYKNKSKYAWCSNCNKRLFKLDE